MRTVLAGGALMALVVACEAAAPAATAPSTPPALKVAFVRDLSVPDADEHALPASQAADLAFDLAALERPERPPVILEEFDLAEGPDTLAEIATDPAFVAAIVAPGVLVDPGALGADVPVVSLSGLGSGAGFRSWVRLVAPLATVAGAFADRLGRSSVCVLSEDPPPDPLAELVTGLLPGATAGRIDPNGSAAIVLDAGCETVLWAGGPDAGAEVAVALDDARIVIVGGDRLLDPDFLTTAGTEAEGALAVCPCANVSSSTALPARRFIQDYQAERGTAPGPYAVEAWDAAHLILRALDEGGPTRSEVGARLGALKVADGLAGTYRFDDDGEPLEPRSLLHLYRVEGGRWAPEPWERVWGKGEGGLG